MNQPHVFSLEQVQRSIKDKSYDHAHWIYWIVNDCIVAFDSLSKFVYAWGFDDIDAFTVIDDEMFKISTENLSADQAPLELFLLYLENSQKHALDFQLENLP